MVNGTVAFIGVCVICVVGLAWNACLNSVRRQLMHRQAVRRHILIINPSNKEVL